MLATFRVPKLEFLISIGMDLQEDMRVINRYLQVDKKHTSDAAYRICKSIVVFLDVRTHWHYAM